MNTRAIRFIILCFVCLLSFSFQQASANNFSVTNVRLGARDTKAKTVTVFFDLAWENSWRNKINHDAVWLTVRLNDALISGSDKKLCRLSAAGLNPVGTAAGTGLEVYVPSDKTGVFIRRSSNGSIGTVTAKNVMLTLDFSSCGFTETSQIAVAVFGLEMVLVPQGDFYAGDSFALAALKQGSGDSSPWHILSEAAIDVTAGTAGGYYYASSGNLGEFATGASFTIPAAYPKGYHAFYAMKYEVTEGQWVDFMNSLLPAARAHRDITDAAHKNSDSVLFRNTLVCSGSPLVCSTQRPARAMTYLSWMDLCAFLDWAALRPMTELEYEKAARGPFLPISGEYAWGDRDIVKAEALSGLSEESGEETVLTNNANANFGSAVFSGGDSASGNEYRSGALRSGIFATSGSDRLRSGAGSYGVMELSGNVWERVVTLGNSAGLSFTGLHGDGYLTTEAGFEGQANVENWPGLGQDINKGLTGAIGSGFRGGSWSDSASYLYVSDRSQSALTDEQSASSYGGRGGRSNDSE